MFSTVILNNSGRYSRRIFVICQLAEEDLVSKFYTGKKV